MSSVPPKPQPPDLAALAAQRRARPRPRPVEGEAGKAPLRPGQKADEAVSEGRMEVDSSPSSMASGFVAMLAKGQVGRGGGAGGGPRAPGTGGARTGVAGGKAEYGLKMAREVLEGIEV